MGGRGSNSNLGGGSGSGLKTTGLDVTHNGADTLRRAFTIAKSGRPGPVLVDITKDKYSAHCCRWDVYRVFRHQGVCTRGLLY